MQTFNKYLIFFLLLPSLNFTYSQDTNIVRYFPLKVGNTWVYNGSHFSIQCASSFYLRVKADSIIVFNGKSYYRMNVLTKILSGGQCAYSFFGNTAYRVDSANGNVYILIANSNCSYSPNERVIDSLKSRVRDTIAICSVQSDPRKVLADTNINQVFGLPKQTKRFIGDNFHEYSFDNRYAKDFGIVSFSQSGMSLSSIVNLKGCIIDGVVYGDTNFYLVPINTISSQIPESYLIDQNYPNPFNPLTNIQFELPKQSPIKIVIYDVSGKEIMILVNEKLKAGKYSVDWNASNYPSGVYFYKLDDENYSQTKKMILLK